MNPANPLRVSIALLVLLFTGSALFSQTTYREVLASSYGSKYQEMLKQKAEYAEANSLILWADYQTIDNAPVIRSVPNPKALSEAVYKVETNEILLYRNASSALDHELGHSLQRKMAMAMKNTSLASHFITDTKAENIDYRLVYLGNQGELEVRLQSLNRVFFQAKGRGIENPGDALCALGMVGLKLRGWNLKDLKKMGIDTSSYAKGNRTFKASEDADTLLTLLDLLHESYPDDDTAYYAALTWMLRNAPAHL